MTDRTSTEIRKIIKTWAAEKGLKYRITGTGAVDFYGEYGIQNVGRGWWFGGYDSEVAQQIVDGLR